jgi:hypothetical protein
MGHAIDHVWDKQVRDRMESRTRPDHHVRSAPSSGIIEARVARP